MKATAKMIKTSVQKLNEVVNLIRNKDTEYALYQLRFCSRRSVSREIMKVLNSAIANSENNHGADIEKLVIDKVLIGKSVSLSRTRFRARGRVNKIIKPYSRVTILLKEEARI